MASIWSNGMQSWNANYSEAEEMGAGTACYTSNADYGYQHRILMCKCPVQDSFMTDGSRYEYCLNVDSEPKECQFEGSGTIYPYTNMELEFEPMTSYAYCVNVNDVSALGACQLCSCGESGVVTETSWIDYNSTAHSVYRNLVSLEETAYDQYNDNMNWSCDASITREYGCAEGYYVSEISGVDVACTRCNVPFTQTENITGGTRSRTCYHTESIRGEARSAADCTGTANCGAWSYSCYANYYLYGTSCEPCSGVSYTETGTDTENITGGTRTRSKSRTCYRSSSPAGSTSASACSGTSSCGSWSYGEWSYSCSSGYYYSGGACYACSGVSWQETNSNQSCSITNGSGSQSCSRTCYRTGGAGGTAGSSSCTGSNCTSWSCGTCYVTGCTTDYYKYTDTTCEYVGNGYYSANGSTSRSQCTGLPDNAEWTGSGGGVNACPWRCQANYYKNGSSCAACSSVAFTDSETITGGTRSRTCYRTTSSAGSTASSQCSGSANCGSWSYSCSSGYHYENGACVSNTKACSGNLSEAQYGNITWNGSAWVYTGCYKDCSGGGIYQGYSYYTGSAWGTCKPISTTSGCHWGYYNNNGQSCDCCPAGYWCFNTQHTCPAGYFCPGCTYDPTYSGYNDQYKCPAGTYCPAGSSAAKSCGTGYTSPAGSDAASDCYAISYSCSEGYYLNGTSCVKCEGNYYCKGGTWSYNGGVQGRNSCSTDTGNRYPYSAAGATAITSCYSATKPRAWSGSQTPCSKENATVTCNACSIAACDYVAYSNSAGTGDGTIKSGCSSNSSSCQQTLKTYACNAKYYAKDGECVGCPSPDVGSSIYAFNGAAVVNSSVGSTSPTQCYLDTSIADYWTHNVAYHGFYRCSGKQYYSTTTGYYSNCESKKYFSECNAGYFINNSTAYNSEFSNTCSECAAGTYTEKYSTASSIGDGSYHYQTSCTLCPAGTYNPNVKSTSASACSSCNTNTGGRYPNSAAGATAITSCYSGTKSRDMTSCTQNECSNPDTTGCASVTCASSCACAGTKCDYVAYSNSAGTGDGTIKSGCSTNAQSCTKGVASLTAKANRYVNGTTSCPACTGVYSGAYPYSAGGNIGSGYCYKNVTLTGTQTPCDKPNNSTEYACDTCQVGTCTYADYYSATDSVCTPANCKQSVKPGSVVCGVNYYTTGTACEQCKNAPGNAHYTGVSSSSSCPWECDSGYNQTSDNQCGQFCTSGITHIKTSTGLSIPLYSAARTSPAINIKWNNQVCYGSLVSGTASGAINVDVGGTKYHTTH